MSQLAKRHILAMPTVRSAKALLKPAGPPPSHVHAQRDNMNSIDASIFPESKPKPAITCAPYGPEWEPEGFPDRDIPVTRDAYVVGLRGLFASAHRDLCRAALAANQR